MKARITTQPSKTLINCLENAVTSIKNPVAATLILKMKIAVVITISAKTI
ncbi:MAG: hypothetical protein KJP26_15180 [Maribacter sp.]|nr:hypothetical protein [Maribacter sp.]